MSIQKIAIISDTSIALPDHISYEKAFIKNGKPVCIHSQGLFLVPNTININGKEYYDQINISTGKMVEFMNKCPKTNYLTSAPSPSRFLETFMRVPKRYTSILCIPLSSKLSASYSAAQMAVNEAKNIPGIHEITLVDSQAATGSLGLIVLKLLEIARQGGSITHLLNTIKEINLSLGMFGYLDGMYYVWRSGRIPKIAYMASSILGIKPIFRIFQNNISIASKVRTKKRGMERLTSLIRNEVGESELNILVLYGKSRIDGLKLADLVRDRLNTRSVELGQFNATTIAHSGPDILGLAYYEG